MAKKIIIAAIVAGALAFVIFVVPRMIEKEKAQQELEMKQMEQKAEERAREKVGRDTDEKKEERGFMGRAIDKSREASDKANNRSADKLEDYGL